MGQQVPHSHFASPDFQADVLGCRQPRPRLLRDPRGTPGLETTRGNPLAGLCGGSRLRSCSIPAPEPRFGRRWLREPRDAPCGWRFGRSAGPGGLVGSPAGPSPPAPGCSPGALPEGLPHPSAPPRARSQSPGGDGVRREERRRSSPPHSFGSCWFRARAQLELCPWVYFKQFNLPRRSGRCPAETNPVRQFWEAAPANRLL